MIIDGIFLCVKRAKMSNVQIAHTLLIVERRMSLLTDIRNMLEKATKDLAAFDTRNAAEMLEREINMTSRNNRIPLAILKK